MTLQLYILRQVLLGVAFAVGGMTFIAIPGLAVNAVHHLGGGSMATILGYLPLVVVELFPYLVPVGFLLAIVSTYGRLAADNEWTAISMAGIHPLRMLLMPLLLAAAFGLGTHWVLAEKTPLLKFQKRAFLRSSVVQAFKSLSPGKTEIELGRFSLIGLGNENDVLQDVIIKVPEEEGAGDTTLFADTARFSFQGDFLVIEMTNARYVQTQATIRTHEAVVRLDLNKLFQVGDANRTKARYKTSDELAAEIAGGQLPAEKNQYNRYEIQHRYALASAYLVFLLLGIPTGLLLRKGTQLGALAISVGYALAYFQVSMRLGKLLLHGDLFSGEAAAWASNALALLCGLFLCYRALRR